MRRCPPTLHGWAHSRHRKDSRGGARPRCTFGHPLNRMGGCRRRCPPTLHGWAHSRRGKRGHWRGCERDERRYPPTLHVWVPFSHQGSRERRFEPRKALRKIGSCSSLNSQKEPIPTQSPPATSRKIRWGRAPVCRCGARGQGHPANCMCESCNRRAARACASTGLYSGP
jgi:hypothetical protein